MPPVTAIRLIMLPVTAKPLIMLQVTAISLIMLPVTVIPLIMLLVTVKPLIMLLVTAKPLLTPLVKEKGGGEGDVGYCQCYWHKQWLPLKVDLAKRLQCSRCLVSNLYCYWSGVVWRWFYWSLYLHHHSANTTHMLGPATHGLPALYSPANLKTLMWSLKKKRNKM